MGFRVIHPGVLTSVQDLGRRGLQQYGVVVSGAMDPLALRVANILVGNDEHAAALETTLLGPEVEFLDEALIAVCGGELPASIDGQFVPSWRAVWIAAGAVLRIGKAIAGCRAYLAIAGGIDVPVVMGSRSTYLRAKMGGLAGRALRVKDQLATGPLSMRNNEIIQRLSARAKGRSFAVGRWFPTISMAYEANISTIRAMRSSECDWLSPESQQHLFSASYALTKESDRMGFRLSGPKLMLTNSGELLSEAVCMGTIQIPPGGQPIILMADCATTGGYAKAAQVATVDLSRLAQIAPGAKFRIQEISINEAQRMYRDQEAMLNKLRHAATLIE